MAKKFKEGDEITITGTVTSVEGDQVCIEVSDGNPDNHHCITLSTAQIEGKSVTGEAED